MRDGRLQQMGPPDDLYHRPANLFVADFIGTPSMNLLDGAELPPEVLRRAGAPAGPDTKDCIFGVRPEDAALLYREHPGALPCTVYAVERLGHQNIVDVQHGSCITRVRTHADDVPDLGTKAWVDVCYGRHPWVFDRRTEKAVIECSR